MTTRKISTIIIILLILSALPVAYIHKSKAKIVINNRIHSRFNDSPITLEDDLMVPGEYFLKALNISTYSWSKEDNKIDIALGHQRIIFWLNKSYCLVNGSIIDYIPSPRLVGSEIYLPLTVLSQGFDFSWSYKNKLLYIEFPNFDYINDFTTPQIHNSPVKTDFLFYGIGLGDLQEQLINHLGWPNRIDESLFDFEWWIYNTDHNHYIQFGIKENKVVAIATNSPNWETLNNITSGTNKQDILSIYGKSNALYSMGNIEFKDERIQDNQLLHYDFEGYNVSFFMDSTNNSVDAIEIYSDTVKRKTFLTQLQIIELSVALERQLFDLTNVSRVKSNLLPLKWDNRLLQVARAHSKDMTNNNYFDHINTSGHTLADRLGQNNITFSKAGENIVSGYQDSLNSYHALLNSPDHRSNIFNQYFTKLAAGFSINQEGSIFFTQVFLQE